MKKNTDDFGGIRKLEIKDRNKIEIIKQPQLRWLEIAKRIK